MENLTQKGLNSFASWLGIPESEVYARLPANPIARQIGEMLHRPPGENFHGDPLLYRTPRVDALYRELANKLGMSPLAFWPRQEPYAVCVTHDIDRVLATVQRAKGFAKAPSAAFSRVVRDLSTALIPSRREANAFFNFDRLLLLEREWKVPSASYVLFEKRRPLFAWQRREIQHVIGVYSPHQILYELKRYQAAGNEVGVHGSFASWDNADVLSSEVETLRQAGLGDVRGVRNHYLNFDRVRTPYAQRKAGVQYDSTLGFNFTNGFRTGTSFPFSLGGVWELPFQLMDSALRYETGSLEEQKQVSQRTLAEVRKVGGVLVLNWHLHVMNPECFPREVAVLDALIQTAKRDGAWFVRPRDLIEWWATRSQRH